MQKKPADILASSAGFDDFREAILSLNGDFCFDPEDMMQLGRIYFLRYPNSAEDRNMENIRTGYSITRVCILEKVLCGVDLQHRELARTLMDDLSLMNDALAKLVKKTGIEEVESLICIIERNLDRVRGSIDELPRGMTKERFVGGISKYYNILYLVNVEIKNLKTAGDPSR